MKRLLLGLGLSAALSMATAATATADPFAGPPICPKAGTPITGVHGSTTISGNRYVPDGRTLTVYGSLTLAPGACLDAFTLGTVHVTGTLLAQRDSILALGCTPGSIGPGPPCNGETTSDTVGGGIVGNHPYTMYLDGDTIWGGINDEGAGPGPVLSPYVNFPIKDNVIYGNVLLDRWKGAWFGFIRNRTYGSVTITNNAGADPDADEVVSNTISGNLMCLNNYPAPQFGDSGGTPDIVGGLNIGQCAGL